MTLRWYVARTRRAWDKVAHAELAKQGFNPWLQTFRIREVVKATFVETERPVFPFYQFIQFDMEDRYNGPRWQCAYSTPNVRHLLPKGAANPVWVPDELVHDLQGVGTVDEVARVLATYVEGETKFWVKMGPFADFIGTYAGVDRGEIEMNVDVFLRKVKIKVPRHWVEQI